MMEQITSKSWFGLNAAIKRKLFLLLLFLVFSLGAAEMQKLLSAVSSGAEKLFAGHRVYGCFLKDTPRCFRKSTAPKSSKLRMNYIYIYYHIDDLKGDSVPVAFDVLEPIKPESEPIPVGTPVIVR